MDKGSGFGVQGLGGDLHGRQNVQNEVARKILQGFTGLGFRVVEVKDYLWLQ